MAAEVALVDGGMRVALPESMRAALGLPHGLMPGSAEVRQPTDHRCGKKKSCRHENMNLKLF